MTIFFDRMAELLAVFGGKGETAGQGGIKNYFQSGTNYTILFLAAAALRRVFQSIGYILAIRVLKCKISKKALTLLRLISLTKWVKSLQKTAKIKKNSQLLASMN